MAAGKSKGHLWLRGRTYYAIWYRNGSRFCVNTQTDNEAAARSKMEILIAECDAGNFKRPDKTPPTLVAMLNERKKVYP